MLLNGALPDFLKYLYKLRSKRWVGNNLNGRNIRILIKVRHLNLNTTFLEITKINNNYYFKVTLIFYQTSDVKFALSRHCSYLRMYTQMNKIKYIFVTTQLNICSTFSCNYNKTVTVSVSLLVNVRTSQPSSSKRSELWLPDHAALNICVYTNTYHMDTKGFSCIMWHAIWFHVL